MIKLKNIAEIFSGIYVQSEPDGTRPNYKYASKILSSNLLRQNHILFVYEAKLDEVQTKIKDYLKEF